MDTNEHFDVAISYASENAEIARQIYSFLTKWGLNVYFREALPEDTLGDDLMKLTRRVYRYQTTYVAALISQHYIRKQMPMMEADISQEREKDLGQTVFLPIYLDGTKFPKLPDDTIFFDARALPAVTIADRIRLRVQRAVTSSVPTPTPTPTSTPSTTSDLEESEKQISKYQQNFYGKVKNIYNK